MACSSPGVGSCILCCLGVSWIGKCWAWGLDFRWEKEKKTMKGPSLLEEKRMHTQSSAVPSFVQQVLGSIGFGPSSV